MPTQDEHSHRGGGFFNFILCVSLLVSSIIYLNRLNNFIEEGDASLSIRKPEDPTCVTSLVPVNSTMTCVNVSQWKTYAILGIVRGSLYILQILSQVFCTRILANETDGIGNPEKRISKRRVLAYCVILVLSLFLSLIPIYLVVNLFRTNAIYTPLSSLANPAMAIFVICILELLALLLFIFCVVPLIVGAACCAICCVCWDKRGRQRSDDEEQETAMKP